MVASYIMGTVRFFVFLAAFAPSIPMMLSLMDGDFGLPHPIESDKPYKYFFKAWDFLTKKFEFVVCILIMADMKLSTDTPFGNPVGKYSFLHLFKVCVYWYCLLGNLREG